MPKYENGVIYKLCHCNDLENENIYIGSTTNFRNRKYAHKFNCNNENSEEYNIPVYEYIRNNGGWCEWQMIPIEKYQCNGKEELKIRERYYIELFKSKLNKQIPTRSQKEYIENNKEKLQEYFKQYHIDNQEKKIKIAKEFYEANKEILNEKIKQKVICDHCGCESTKGNLKRHQKSNKCKNYNITKE